MLAVRSMGASHTDPARSVDSGKVEASPAALGVLVMSRLSLGEFRAPSHSP